LIHHWVQGSQAANPRRHNKTVQPADLSESFFFLRRTEKVQKIIFAPHSCNTFSYKTLLPMSIVFEKLNIMWRALYMPEKISYTAGQIFTGI
jgi:hypothetical protein